MTAAGGVFALALITALADAVAPSTTAPSPIRRLLRLAPAAAAAVALRLADAPALPALALLAFAGADALALDGQEPGVGGWTLALLGDLLLAAALWELASAALIAREPWRGVEALAVLAGAVALSRRARRLRGELAALAPVAVVLLAAAAAAAGAQPAPELARAFAAAVALWAAAAAWAWLRPAGAPLGRAERGLRSAAALALAAPLLPAWLG